MVNGIQTILLFYNLSVILSVSDPYSIETWGIFQCCFERNSIPEMIGPSNDQLDKKRTRFQCCLLIIYCKNKDKNAYSNSEVSKSLGNLNINNHNIGSGGFKIPIHNFLHYSRDNVDYNTNSKDHKWKNSRLTTINDQLNEKDLNQNNSNWNNSHFGIAENQLNKFDIKRNNSHIKIAKNHSNNDNLKNLLPINCGEYNPDLLRTSCNDDDTQFGEFPWIALLQYRDKNGQTEFGCGGSLINNRYILTAAHCIRAGEAANWTLEAVRLGEYNTATDPDCTSPCPEQSTSSTNVTCADNVTVVGVEEKIVHQDFSVRTIQLHNDIALLRLSRPVTFTNYVKPICLPSSPTVDRSFIVAGWGRIDTLKDESPILLKIDLPFVDYETCRDIFSREPKPRQIIRSQICAGGEEDKDTCSGDSGTPLMQLNSWSGNVRGWEVAGITSYGSNICGKPGVPGVYTNVSHFVPWILSKLRP